VRPFSRVSTEKGISKREKRMENLLGEAAYHTGPALSASSFPPVALAALLLAALPARGAEAQEQEAQAPPPALAPGPAATAPPSVPKFSFSVVLSDLEPTRERGLRLAELLYASVAATWWRGDWGAEAEVRGKDGRFRPYYGGDAWLQKGAAVVRTPVGELRVGKVDSVALPADETFSGTLFSDNGAVRNPEWGASLSGEERFGWNSLAWAVRYAGQNDHVAWEEEGRNVESDAGARLSAAEARAAYLVNRGLVTLRPALSLSAASIDSPAAGGSFSRVDVGADVRLSAGPAWLSVLAMNRNGNTGAALASGAPGQPRFGYDRSWSWLFAFGAEFPTVTYRYSYSEWNYRGLDAGERIHQPSVVWTPRKGIEATIEYSARRLRVAGEASTFNAFRFGLGLSF
jgi:hypothetical protein